MKKPLKVFLVVLAVLLVLLIAVGVWQKDNISALFGAMKYSEEDISGLITDNEELVNEALNEFPEVAVREASVEEMAALEAGDITQDDLVNIILGTVTLEDAIAKNKDAPPAAEPSTNTNTNTDTNVSAEDKKPPQTAKPSPKPSPSPSPSPTPAPVKNGDEEVAALVAKVYILKSSFVGQIETLLDGAKKEYFSYPKEQRTTSLKQKIMGKRLAEISALEADCDVQINAILTELTDVLKRYNRDLSLVDSIKKAYSNEKQLKKSYYISKYL